ncbi:MAG: hypothetical protein ACRD88_06895 [Terriglobia bacterium]
MRSFLAGSIHAVLAVLAFSLSLHAQTAARSRSGGSATRPDFAGIWTGRVAPLTGAGAFERGPSDAFGGIPAPGFSREEPQMLPWAQAKYRTRREGRQPNERGREEGDPTIYPYCQPRTFPRVYNFGGLFELVQTPNQVYMLFEGDHHVRRIFLDGKRHLEGWAPSRMGVSHGRWDGDTLVVETTNILSLDRNGWLDAFGHPFTDSLKVTERIRRTARDTLQIDLMFDDPETYTGPWPGRKVFELRPDWDVLDTATCEDHWQEDYLRDVRDGKLRGGP